MINTCPITQTETSTKYFNLGNMPLVNDLCLTREDSLKIKTYKLELQYFNESGLTSLTNEIEAKKLFNNYLFKTSVNKPYIEHCKKMFEYIQSMVNIDDNTNIMDIGGNDGTLLKTFKDCSDKKLKLLNIEPSDNLSKISKSIGIPTINNFFNENVFEHVSDKFDVIISTNVFQHLKNIDEFVKTIKKILKEDGIWVLEFPYWIHNMNTNQFDQIYHEHIYYYSVSPLVKLMQKHNLKINVIIFHDMHSGSLRLIISHDTSNVIKSDGSVEKYIEMEKKYTLDSHINWGKNIKNHINDCKTFINTLIEDGYKIVGFGASAKGGIFLNSLGLDYTDIPYIIDDTDIKQGKFLPKLGIEIVDRNIIQTYKPDYILILSHNFKEYIMESLSDIYDEKFIICFPELKIL